MKDFTEYNLNNIFKNSIGFHAYTGDVEDLEEVKFLLQPSVSMAQFLNHEEIGYAIDRLTAINALSNTSKYTIRDCLVAVSIDVYELENTKKYDSIKVELVIPFINENHTFVYKSIISYSCNVKKLLLFIVKQIYHSIFEYSHVDCVAFIHSIYDNIRSLYYKECKETLININECLVLNLDWINKSLEDSLYGISTTKIKNIYKPVPNIIQMEIYNA